MDREQILGQKKRKVVKVKVAQWGGDVHLRGWTVAEVEEYRKWLQEVEASGESGVEVLLKTVQESLCDARGELLFGPDDHEAMSQLDLSALRYLADQVLVVNGMSAEQKAGFRS